MKLLGSETMLSFVSFLARDATIQKIEVIIRDQFALEMKNKEHEIEVIGQVRPVRVCLFVCC